jgi:nucleoside-diphosphate kinase
MVSATKDIVKLHYPNTDEWFTSVGNKTLKSYREYGLNPLKDLGTDNPLEIGKIVKNWLLEYITSSPVVCMVIEGNRAIENVRRIVGNTIPTLANPGSIRGDFSTDSPDLANKQKRPIRNLVHASGDTKEAEHEIKLWFKENELHEYNIFI